MNCTAVDRILRAVDMRINAVDKIRRAVDMKINAADQIRRALTRRGCGLYPPCGVPGEIPSLHLIVRNPGESVVMQWLFAVISGQITGDGAHAQ